ncbi:alpha,alpha-trehalase TreF [Pontibacter diazotrophicus]|uniref:Alpha,alpha-trehalase TreF n=1 Tax=Pontibacter diazotrophicus TaxID=1400979 RepID=A0A3D8KZ24_9BACT|nr:alpha,alpha-trehalase TreF [Pontibacter diazotrophicus]RDV10363.1 alpha,alpha-trehalase TreF [Pontibacter diazotrophicus]
MKRKVFLSTTFKSLLFLLFSFIYTLLPLQAQQLYQPAEQLGELFEQVQLQSVFPDSKTFPDATPLASPDEILQAYQQQKDQPGFDLRTFVMNNFEMPPQPAADFRSDTSLTVIQHIEQLWPVLTRQPGNDAGSLIPLPNAYVVPGGRFREIYYWDSFFTMLGLQASGETELIQNMVDNFTHLINTTGHIPNGNRTYYLSRSQPPFYALMLRVLAQQKGKEILTNYAPALKKEYDFWMEGANTLNAANPAHRRVVRLPDGSILNRYWDDKPEPRPESYLEDVHLAQESGRNPEELYRHIRAAAESGWDFSSRWFSDANSLGTIHTTDIIPVDLNALLFHTEMTLAQMAEMQGNKAEAKRYEQRAKERQKALLKYAWNEADDFFYDYDFVKGTTTNIPTLAAVFPLYFCMAKRKHASAVAQKIEADFLKPGGVVTTLNRTGQQWDSPNGWAPLQWMTIQALRNYKHTRLADTIARNWTRRNIEVYQATGKLVEKYNVEDLTLEAGGGEYPNQDGFGWTNGVLLKLLTLHPELLQTTEQEAVLQR